MIVLKPKLAFEVRKDNCMKFEDACRIALRVQFTLHGIPFDMNGIICDTKTTVAYNGPEQMEIGNSEIIKAPDDNIQNKREDFRNNACFKCHKPGCRP